MSGAPAGRWRPARGGWWNGGCDASKRFSSGPWPYAFWLVGHPISRWQEIKCSSQEGLQLAVERVAGVELEKSRAAFGLTCEHASSFEPQQLILDNAAGQPECFGQIAGVRFPL